VWKTTSSVIIWNLEEEYSGNWSAGLLGPLLSVHVAVSCTVLHGNIRTKKQRSSEHCANGLCSSALVDKGN
jgi:hypothetical protein